MEILKNIMGKEGHAGYQHYLLFLQCFYVNYIMILCGKALNTAF